MNVAKYIGLFLLKNEQCYVNGLGTLQLLRKPASYNGTHLIAASHEINIVPGGNVDESLANYIATNEQVSITKASAALKEFSSNTKSRLQAGEVVPLPYLGKFTSDEGRIGFTTATHLQFQPAAIAANRGLTTTQKPQERTPIPHTPYTPNTPIGSPLATAPQQPPAQATPAMPTPQHQTQQHNYAEEDNGTRINWARIIFVLLLLIVLAAGAFYCYKRWIAPKHATTTNTTNTPQLTMPTSMDGNIDETELDEENNALLTDSSIVDTTNNLSATSETEEIIGEVPAKEEVQTEPVREREQAPPPTTTKKKFFKKIILKTYDKKADAYNHKRLLNSKGIPAQVIEEDVNYFFVTLDVNTNTTDSAKVMDSMSRKFNPENGVIIY